MLKQKLAKHNKIASVGYVMRDETINHDNK